MALRDPQVPALRRVASFARATPAKRQPLSP